MKILQPLCLVILGVTKYKMIKSCDQIVQWRIELSQYCYDIVYRQGKVNVSDALSRV